MAGGGGAAAGMWRTKRKEAAVDDGSDEFSDFSLFSLARKIRRLDVDLPPIMESAEEEEEAPPPAFGRPRGVVIDELSPSSLEENPERAIVVFSSVGASNPPLYSPSGSESGFSVSMSSDLLSGLKSKYKKLWADHEEEDRIGERAAKECMAVVPWVPSRFPSATDVTRTGNLEIFDDGYMGEAEMEIEGVNGGSLERLQGFQFDSVPQWQQQHCMAPDLPQNNPTPLTWFPVSSNHRYDSTEPPLF